MTKLNDIRNGSKVLVATNFGAGLCVTGVVREVCEDVKNNQPGIVFVTANSTGRHWAYLDQVRKVVTF